MILAIIIASFFIGMFACAAFAQSGRADDADRDLINAIERSRKGWK